VKTPLGRWDYGCSKPTTHNWVHAESTHWREYSQSDQNCTEEPHPNLVSTSSVPAFRLHLEETHPLCLTGFTFGRFQP
jgi:hypothetical protein